MILYGYETLRTLSTIQKCVSLGFTEAEYLALSEFRTLVK